MKQFTGVLLKAMGLILVSSCGGGGGDDGGGSSTTAICYNCVGASGTMRLWCETLNSSAGCDSSSSSTGPAPPPNAIGTFSLLNPSVPGHASNTGLFDVTVPAGTGVTALVAKFSLEGPPGASVTVAGVPQTSGVTANDFTGPVTYTVVPASGATRTQVATVTVAPPTNIWTWVSGSNAANHAGVYGTQGVAATANAPGGRHEAVSWVDRSGQFWIFGGYGVDALGSSFHLNDLWRFDGANWAWMGGSNTINQPGIYGTKGTASPGNVPGARVGAASWSDANGALWVFGGFGVDAGGAYGYFNDLWKFDGVAWTWVSGSTTRNPVGVYGTKGVAAAGNIPEGRNGSSAWVGTAGDFWIFGGSSSRGILNDLWRFDGTNWTWVNGNNTVNTGTFYGTQGVPSSGPGARQKAASWADKAGNLWLFGGSGYVQQFFAGAGYVLQGGELNDLWKFDGVNWIWVSGANVPNDPGVPGTSGVAAAANVPSARHGAVTWVDANAKTWLFGGGGITVSGGSRATGLSDLWNFDGTHWTRVGAANLPGSAGLYGARRLAIVAAPYARAGAVAGLQASGKVWLFGGGGFNDLMVYEP